MFNNFDAIEGDQGDEQPMFKFINKPTDFQNLCMKLGWTVQYHNPEQTESSRLYLKPTLKSVFIVRTLHQST
jgi:hypothetical protein